MLALHDVKPNLSKTLVVQPFNITLTLDSEGVEEAEFIVVYGGSPNTDAYDQIISNNIIGPIPRGLVKFDLECLIDFSAIPLRHLFGVTSIVVIGKYNEQEFLRIGYFAKVEYPDISIEELKCDDGEMESEIDESNCEEEGFDSEECLGDESEKVEDSSEKELCCEKDKISTQTGNQKELESKSLHKIAEEALEDEYELEAGNTTANLITDSILEKIKDAESLLEEKKSVEGVDKFAVSNESSFEELNQIVEEDVLGDLVKDYIFEWKGHHIDIRKVTVELCEPPIETPFKIKWNNNEEAVVEEESIEESEENKIDVNSMESGEKKVQNPIENGKKRKLDE